MAWFQVNFFSACLGRKTSLQVLLPETPPVGEGEAKYKTLYLLHGYMGNCTDWLLNTQINDMSQQFGLAVIMPSGDNGFYVDQPTSGVLGGTFIGRELVEYTRRIFPLSDKREDTIIGGLSMGGYGALINALRFNDVFGHCIGLSSAILTETCKGATDEINMLGINKGYFERLLGDLAKAEESDASVNKLSKEVLASGGPIPDYYFACGYNDALSFINRGYHRHLESIGFPHVYEEGPGTHEWPFWNTFLRRGLVHIFGEPKGGFVNPFRVDNYDPEFDVIGKAD